MIVVRCTERDKEALERMAVDPEDIKDDGTDYRELRVKKPWGHEVEKYRDDSLSVWWLHIHTWEETSMHCHPNKTTALFVMGGEGMLYTLNGEHVLSEGEVVIIEKGAFHRTSSSGGPIMLYELESPPNKRDLVRLADRYQRGQGYECVSMTR